MHGSIPAAQGDQLIYDSADVGCFNLESAKLAARGMFHYAGFVEVKGAYWASGNRPVLHVPRRHELCVTSYARLHSDALLHVSSPR